MPGLDVVERALDRGLVADVEGMGGVRSAEFVGHAAGAPGIHVRDHDAEAGQRQLLADGGADAAAAAGYQRETGSGAGFGGRGYIGHAVSSVACRKPWGWHGRYR
ncbi:hypothetical protein D9M69_657040 [compost metagenome]